MTLRYKYVYSSQEIDADTLFMIASRLFELRHSYGYSLHKVSKETHISVDEIEMLERSGLQIDFRKVCILLKFYQTSLDDFDFSLLPNFDLSLQKQFFKP